MNLPQHYSELTPRQRKLVREEYVKRQNNICMYCGGTLKEGPPKEITSNPINWKLFPKGFLKYPIHLQHSHDTGLTEGAVHAYCNAVLWQYHGQ
jgi:hypothetical protein